MYKVLFGFYVVVLIAVLLDAEAKIFDINLLNLLKQSEYSESANAKGYDLDSYEKRKPKPPQNITNITLALRKYLDDEFYGSVRIGSRGQEFHVIFDTAWTSSWIMSKDCAPSVTGCEGHQLYDHDRSATYVRIGNKFSANVDNYTLLGYYSCDKINFGRVTVNVTFIEMTDVPPAYKLNIADGVIGLSPSYGGEKTLPEILYNKGLIKEPIFSIYINRDYQSNRGGDILLGAYNPKHIHGPLNEKDPITYVRVDDSGGRWAFKMDRVAIKIGNQTLPITGKSAFINTATIGISAPKVSFDEINYRIHATPDDGSYAVDCDKVRKMPPIIFTIGGKEFMMKGIDYTRKKTVRNVIKCYSVFVDGGSGDEWALGASFLSRYYTIYNFESKVIGFVRAG